MRTRRVIDLAVFLAHVLVGGGAWADTARVAVVVGSNTGAGDEKPLRYAEDDAGKMARLLTELGSVAPGDLFLVQGRSLGELRGALALAQARVEAAHRIPDRRALLLFYFSGHSDGEALEVGAERLSYRDLKRILRDTGAEVRVAVVDSCRSGALLASKGARPGKGFQIRMANDLASTGEVLMTSSAADELALESAELRGSFFTHHLLSGLRGAADSSGDGRVTLAEAYQYAYAHTVSGTTDTEAGPQHPGYLFDLSGEGELVLTDLSRPTATLRLPSGFDRIVVTDLRRDQIIAELGSASARRLAVAAGSFGVRAFRGGQIYAARIEVADEDRVVDAAELSPQAEPLSTASAKGPAVQREGADEPGALVVEGGALVSPTYDLGALGGARVEWLPWGWGGWAFGGEVARQLSGAGETALELSGGYRWSAQVGPVAPFVGLDLAAGAVWPTAGQGEPVLGAAASTGVRVALGDRFSWLAEVRVVGGYLPQGSGESWGLQPSGWTGVGLQF